MGLTNNDIEKPDRLVFDLDPDEAIPWKTLAESAKEVRSRLKDCKLESFLKPTGGKGLHIVAPIQPEHDWPIIKEFAHDIANQMAAENKALYLTKMTKADRKGKIFIDYLRNDRGATSIAPFSPRARHGAPVAVPMDWKELDSSKPPRFLVADFSEWKSRLRHDPWTAMLKKRNPFRRNYWSPSLLLAIRSPVHVVRRGRIDLAFFRFRRWVANGCVSRTGGGRILSVIARRLYGMFAILCAVLSFFFFLGVHTVSSVGDVARVTKPAPKEWMLSELLGSLGDRNECGGD